MRLFRIPHSAFRNLFLASTAVVLGLAIVGATLQGSRPGGLASLPFGPQGLQGSPALDDPRQADVRGGQEVERMSAFEFVVNSVIGRSLNVPGKD